MNRKIEVVYRSAITDAPVFKFTVCAVCHCDPCRCTPLTRKLYAMIKPRGKGAKTLTQAQFERRLMLLEMLHNSLRRSRI